MDAAVLGNTIARIYDAALSPRNWNRVLDDVTHAVSGKASAIIHAEPTYQELRDSGIYYSAPITEPDVIEYATRFAQNDRLDAVFTRPYLSVIRASEVMKTDAEFAHSPLQQMLLERFGVFDRVAARLNQVDSWAAMISVYCDKDGPGMTREQ